MGILSQLFSNPLLFLVFIVVFLFTLAIHEASHALAAHWEGDETARRVGRLTLNPFAHVDLLGMLVLITVGFGWGKPVPFNPYNLKHRRWGPTFVAIAGPVANLVGGALCALIGRFVAPWLGTENLLIMVLEYGAFMNFSLLLFNLIPLPPLDGSKILLSILADERYAKTRMFLETRGPFLLLLFILADTALGINLFGWISRGALGLVNFFG
jgi:Zn-dependent protease